MLNIEGWYLHVLKGSGHICEHIVEEHRCSIQWKVECVHEYKWMENVCALYNEKWKTVRIVSDLPLYVVIGCFFVCKQLKLNSYEVIALIRPLVLK